VRALVLSGGEGSRLRPITHTNAKQLIPVANTPILFHVLGAIRDAGISEVGIVVGQTADEVKAAVGEGSAWGLDVTYIHQEAPLGLAHAVLTAEEFVRGRPFVMYLGDNVLLEGIDRFVRGFERHGPDAQIFLARVPEPERFGVAVLEGDRVVRLGFGWNTRDIYRSGRVGLRLGRVASGDYRFLSAGQGFKFSNALSFRLSAEHLRLEFDDPDEEDESENQIVLTGIYDLTNERGIALRAVARDAGFNFYAAYRQEVRRGADIFFILGDPNADRLKLRRPHPLAGRHRSPQARSEADRRMTQTRPYDGGAGLRFFPLRNAASLRGSNDRGPTAA